MNSFKKSTSAIPVRVRYAPSPTGFLHIGNARIALFNYLFAHHFNGTFVLRTEDTDDKRNISGSIESQYNNLLWLGIKPDESQFTPGQYGPYCQSERLAIYQKYAYKLITQGYAYYCFCTPEILDKMRLKQKMLGHQAFKYDETCCHLSPEVVKKQLANKTPHVVRLKVPSIKEIKISDLTRGVITFQQNNFGD